jgi:hypothetical protein
MPMSLSHLCPCTFSSDSLFTVLSLGTVDPDNAISYDSFRLWALDFEIPPEPIPRWVAEA